MAGVPRLERAPGLGLRVVAASSSGPVSRPTTLANPSDA